MAPLVSNGAQSPDSCKPIHEPAGQVAHRLIVFTQKVTQHVIGVLGALHGGFGSKTADQLIGAGELPCAKSSLTQIPTHN